MLRSDDVEKLLVVRNRPNEGLQNIVMTEGEVWCVSCGRFSSPAQISRNLHLRVFEVTVYCYSLLGLESILHDLF